VQAAKNTFSSVEEALAIQQTQHRALIEQATAEKQLPLKRLGEVERVLDQVGSISQQITR
jgi:hypothetical protein